MAYLHAFDRRTDTADPAFRLPASPAVKAEDARAEFVDACECRCPAHFAEAGEDAQNLEAIAGAVSTCLTKVTSRLEQMSYASKAFDAASLRACLIENVTDCLTPEAGAFVRAAVSAALTGRG